jgi:hypothetical protein
MEPGGRWIDTWRVRSRSSRTAIDLAGIPACEIVVQAEPDYESRVAVLLADNPGRCLLYETFTSIEYQFANLPPLADEILDIVGSPIKASAEISGGTQRTPLTRS